MTFVTVVRMRTASCGCLRTTQRRVCSQNKCSARTPGPWSWLRTRRSSTGTSPGLQRQGGQAPRATPLSLNPRPRRRGLQPAAAISRPGASHPPARASGPCPGGLSRRDGRLSSEGPHHGRPAAPHPAHHRPGRPPAAGRERYVALTLRTAGGPRWRAGGVREMPLNFLSGECVHSPCGSSA